MHVVQADTVLMTTVPMLGIGIVFSIIAIFAITMITAMTNVKTRRQNQQNQQHNNKYGSKVAQNGSYYQAVYIDTGSSAGSLPFLLEANDRVFLKEEERDIEMGECDDSIYSTDIEKESVVCTFGTDTLEGLLAQEQFPLPGVNDDDLDVLSMKSGAVKCGGEEEKRKVVDDRVEKSWEWVSVQPSYGESDIESKNSLKSLSAGEIKEMQRAVFDEDKDLHLGFYQVQKLSTCTDFILIDNLGSGKVVTSAEAGCKYYYPVDDEEKLSVVTTPSEEIIDVASDRCEEGALINATDAEQNASLVFLTFLMFLFHQLLDMISRARRPNYPSV